MFRKHRNDIDDALNMYFENQKVSSALRRIVSDAFQKSKKGMAEQIKREMEAKDRTDPLYMEPILFRYISTDIQNKLITDLYVGLNDSHFLECAFNLISSLEYNTFFLKLVSHMSQRHVTEQRIVFDSNYTKNWRGLLYLRSGTVFQVSIVPHSVR